mmetsp:Transcript_34349/g.41502  ORF Transcript_34349/g.41502 Transcript_34349/m.41502 type:complete len:219 (+) Transcript_34349:548-1204(+)
MSYIPIAIPTGCHAAIIRENPRCFVASANEITPGILCSSGTIAFTSVISPFCVILIEVLLSIFSTDHPTWVLGSTINAFTFPPSSKFFAYTTHTSAKVELPIHLFFPFSFQPPGTFSAVVSMEAASLPQFGSVIAQHPMCSNEANLGRYLAACSGVPLLPMVYIQSESCTRNANDREASTRASSIIAIASCMSVQPLQPFPVCPHPPMPSSPSLGRRW